MPLEELRDGEASIKRRGTEGATLGALWRDDTRAHMRDRVGEKGHSDGTESDDAEGLVKFRGDSKMQTIRLPEFDVHIYRAQASGRRGHQEPQEVSIYCIERESLQNTH